MTITQDVRFQSEVVPPSLLQLSRRLAEHFGVPMSHLGIKGDTAHRRGYHRSRRFLRNSHYSGDRNYSVTDHPANETGGRDDWIAGLDISLPAEKLIPMCRRLDEAVRAGRLEKVAEWYGNDDGDNRVDGYDNIRNRIASADSSHLWHAHLGFLRAHAGDDHSDLFAILTGTEDEDDMPTMDELVNTLVPAVAKAVWAQSVSSKNFEGGTGHGAHEGVLNAVDAAKRLKALEHTVNAIAVKVGVPLTVVPKK